MKYDGRENEYIDYSFRSQSIDRVLFIDGASLMCMLLFCLFFSTPSDIL